MFYIRFVLAAPWIITGLLFFGIMFIMMIIAFALLPDCPFRRVMFNFEDDNVT